MPAAEVLLTTLLLIPAVGSTVLILVPPGRSVYLRGTALLTSLVTFACSLLLVADFDSTAATMQFVENRPWFRLAEFQVHYHVGLDGISLFLVVLTTFLMPLAILASWHINTRLKAYLFSMLLLEIGILGAFVSLDLILFYIFWEVMLIPMYFIIGIWGGKRRVYAAVKFFLYTAAGSLFMLAAIIALYFLTGSQTFDTMLIIQNLSSGQVTLTSSQEVLLFLAFFVAFAIKVPLFPLHTWLPDAHVEAPTAGSVVLAGVLLKMGTYGLLRFCLPLFPAASLLLAPWISFLAIVGILYGALLAMVQTDVKRLVAYSSVSHLGLVVLGIFSFNFQSIQGATYQMLNHGISTGALFLLVGMIYQRRHTRLISEFGGLARVMPRYATLFMLLLLSSIGLPGLNGFVGEFLILQGAFLHSPVQAAIASMGVILAAVYMLWMYQRVFMGPVENVENQRLADLNGREMGILIPLVILVFWMGLYSTPWLRPMDLSIERVLERIEQGRSPQLFRAENRGT